MLAVRTRVGLSCLLVPAGPPLPQDPQVGGLLGEERRGGVPCPAGRSRRGVSGDPGPITACNCTLCRRYGTLWAYDYEDERIRVTGTTRAYTRRGKTPALAIHFCVECGCVTHWRGLRVGEDIDCQQAPFQGATGKTTTLTETVFSTIPGSPAFPGKASRFRRAGARHGLSDVDISGRNAIQGMFSFSG